MMLANQKIILGICGGIAAYKSAELIRLLREQQAQVQVVMTEAASHFINPLTYQALSGRPVRERLLDTNAEAGMGHIELAKWADFVVIAPASAQTIARLSHGLADDLLSTLCLATPAPIILAPAMNQQMWRHPATQRNINQLRHDRVIVIGPGEGVQACGDIGPGRLIDTSDIVSEIIKYKQSNEKLSPDLNDNADESDKDQITPKELPLDGVCVLITAGATRERIDPVRYISNDSSGKMGFALAAQAAELGAKVTLVHGPVHLPPLDNVNQIEIQTGDQMWAAVHPRLATSEIFIATAAVADYKIAKPAAHKIKKKNQNLSLELVPTIDILKSVGEYCVENHKKILRIGFAAETENVIANGREKLTRKNCHLIATNDVGDANIGFNSEENEINLVWGVNEIVHFNRQPKVQIANKMAHFIADHFHQFRNLPIDKTL